MAFGPIMKFQAKELELELAPFTREDVAAFVAPGFQQHSVTRYLHRHAQAFVLEDEQEWYDKVRADKDRLIWGIWVIENGKRTLIGNSAINDIQRYQVSQGTTGVVITDKAYWGKGIASHIHMARTWFAFQHLGLTRLKSAVIQGNDASLRALLRSGYAHVYTERNEQFSDGQLRHLDCLECINPADDTWKTWWGESKPSKDSLAARERTRAAMAWAADHVTLP